MFASELEFKQVQNREDVFRTIPESIKSFINRSEPELQAENFFWARTERKIHIQSQLVDRSGVAHSKPINTLPRINKFLEHWNGQLEKEQYIMICLETKNARKARLLNKFPRFISRPLYLFDFFFSRVLPKTKHTRSIYFKLTKGKNRVITLTEALGRLKSCGFDCVNQQRIGYYTYILAKKNGRPVYDMEPTYGAIVKLKRVGYKGKRIQLYKLRTMHPYSEYLQEYMFEQFGTEDGDKIKNDFRVTNWGKIFRKFWIDELPMLWNWVKRDLKLVGVRPLSEHKFYTYPEHLQEKRVQVKPGLVPPYYVDLPDTPEEFFKTEERYLDAYLEKPIRTDIKYFFKAMYNILIKRARSA